jgi:hypothetical protein
MQKISEELGYFGSPDLFETLLRDARQSFEELSSNKQSQYLRRNAVRATFGLIEAICSVLCNEVWLKHYSGRIVLSEKERRVIEKKETELIQRIKKSFSSYAKLYGCSFALNTSTEGYEYLKLAKGIRNRVVHPVCYKDILISDGDMFKVAHSYVWIKEEFIRLMNTVVEKNLSRIPEPEREALREIINGQT